MSTCPVQVSQLEPSGWMCGVRRVRKAAAPRSKLFSVWRVMYSVWRDVAQQYGPCFSWLGNFYEFRVPCRHLTDPSSLLYFEVSLQRTGST